jgi:putative endonuclease
LEEHNSGITKSTKSGIPWEIIYSKTFNSRTEAVQLEQKLKKAKNKKYIKWFIENSSY